jgi:hypothetical protein
VTDDGHGIDVATAHREFGVLGDSWKAGATHSKNGLRTLHGSKGEGRLSVFKHGGTARWRSVSELGGSREKLTITVNATSREDAEVSDAVATTGPLGTVVTLTNFAEPPTGIHGETAYERLLTTFAIAIRAQGVDITFADRRLDVADLLLYERDIPIRARGEDALLTLLIWKRKVRPDAELHFCDRDGTTLLQSAQAESHGASFTAYLRWNRTSEYARQLPTAGHDEGPLGAVSREAELQLQLALNEHRDQRRREVIDAWKRNGYYPFDGEPSTSAERATRQTFDLVAVEAATVVDASKPKARMLSLRLLTEALEHNPDQIHRILDQVLGLNGPVLGSVPPAPR